MLILLIVKDLFRNFSISVNDHNEVQLNFGTKAAVFAEFDHRGLEISNYSAPSATNLTRFNVIIFKFKKVIGIYISIYQYKLFKEFVNSN
jgi:hypothetical protein